MSDDAIVLVLVLLGFALVPACICGFVWSNDRYQKNAKAERKRKEEELKFAYADPVPPPMDYRNQRKSKFDG